MFVFLLFRDVGFYMEPDVEVLGVFDKKKDALEFMNELKKKEQGRYHKYYYWIKKYKVKNFILKKKGD